MRSGPAARRRRERHRGHLLLEEDPFTTPIGDLLSRLDETLHQPTFGGMASAGQAPGIDLLLLGDPGLHGGGHRDRVRRLGPAGHRRLPGLPPGGEPMIVTRRRGTGSRAGTPALESSCGEMFDKLTEAERELFQAGPFLGIVVNECEPPSSAATSWSGPDGRGSRKRRPGRGGHGPGRAEPSSSTSGTAPQRTKTSWPSWSRGAARNLRPAVFSSPATGAAPDVRAAAPEPRTTRSVLPDLPLAGFFAMGEARSHRWKELHPRAYGQPRPVPAGIAASLRRIRSGPRRLRRGPLPLGHKSRVRP